MAGGKLEVQIGADKSDFDKKIKEIEFDIKELSKVKLDRLKLGLDTSEINAQIKDAKNNLNSLRTTVKDTGQSFADMKPKVANGGNALMQFSRIAQDAPFGIMGIGNNITATTEAFASLKQQTGSTGGALKALASSLMGTGGILLGVSLLTTGFTLLAQSGLSVSDVIKKLTGNFDELGDEMGKANAEAVKNASSEITGFKALLSVAGDVNTSMQKRNLAVDELQKKYPAYLGNLTREQILNGETAKVTEELSKAIIAKAKAQAFANKIADLAEKSLKNDLEAAKSRKELIKLENELLLAKQNTAAAQFGGVTAEGAGIDAVNQAIKTQKNNIFDLIKANKANANIMAIYTKEVEKATDASILLNQEPPKAAKKPKAEKSKFEFDPTFIAPFVSTISGLGDTMDGFANRTAVAFENATGKVKEQTDQMKLILQEFNIAVNDLIQNSIATTFSELGNAIGTAIASGGDVLSAIGQSLIQGLSNFLSQLGDKLITYGLLLAAFGKAELAFAVGDPVTKIGAGIAMVALGVAAKAAGAVVSSFGGGFSGSGGRASSSTGAGANNQSFSSSGFSSASGGGTVVFEISGQKLIGVLSNTINGNKRLGGTLGLG